jgi:hypothetical protein
MEIYNTVFELARISSCLAPPHFLSFSDDQPFCAPFPAAGTAEFDH